MASTLLACALIPFPPYVGPEGILSFTTDCGERKAGKRGLNMGLGNFYRRRIKGQTMCLKPGSSAIATWHISIHILHFTMVVPSDVQSLRVPRSCVRNAHPDQSRFTLFATWQIWKLKFTPDYKARFLNIKGSKLVGFNFLPVELRAPCLNLTTISPLATGHLMSPLQNHLNNQPFLRPNLGTKPSSLYPDSLKEAQGRSGVRPCFLRQTCENGNDRENYLPEYDWSPYAKRNVEWFGARHAGKFIIAASRQMEASAEASANRSPTELVTELILLSEILGQMVLLHQMSYRDIYQSARNHCNHRGAYTTPFRHELGVTGSIEKKDLVKR